MRTLKLRLMPEPRDGMKIELEIDTIVGSEEEAMEEGRILNRYVTRFLLGYAQENTDDSTD